MRAAIVAALKADAAVAALVGARVYPRLGIFGGIPDDAYGLEGDLLGPAIVVVQESRVRHERDRGDPGVRVIRAVQTFALFAYAPEGMGGDAFRVIRQVHRAARRRLHRANAHSVDPPPLVPLEETEISWLETRWAGHGPEQMEAPRNIPVIVARYDCTITDPL